MSAVHFPVSCSFLTSGLVRTVVASREDYTFSFNRTWQEYRDGLGDPGSSSYWIGLERLRQLTWDRQYELRFNVKLQNRTTLYQYYNNFTLGNESSWYPFSFELPALTVTSETAPRTSSEPVSAPTTSTTTTPSSTVRSVMAPDGGSRAITVGHAILLGLLSRRSVGGGRVWKERRSGFTSLEIVSLSNWLCTLYLRNVAAESFLGVFVFGICLLCVCFGVARALCFVLDFLCRRGRVGGGGGLFLFGFVSVYYCCRLAFYWLISFWW